MNLMAEKSLKHHLSFRFSKPAFLLLTFTLLVTFLLISSSNASAQSPCGDNYIVLPGDTVEEIADLCGTTVEAILEVNPEITDPNNLYTGQIIRIPEPEIILQTVVAIYPACGLPGEELLVVGSGFPENSVVEVSVRQVDRAASIVRETVSDQFGRIDITTNIPDDAEPETAWVVVSDSQISSARFLSVSNEFYVIESVPDPNSATTYVAQEGDTLRSIAAKFNRDFGSILEANPQITITDQINPGQSINIPSQESGIAATNISPVCGPAETDILVIGNGFPPSARIELSLGQYLVSYQQAGASLSSTTGAFQAQLIIPPDAQNMDHWVVVAATDTAPFVRSTSNIYIVTTPKDPKKPELYIVQAGDTLNAIAAAHTRTVASILAVNPQITNPNQLNIGDKVIIPGEKETLILSPTIGIPSTTIQVLGFGFAPNSTVVLGLARETTVVDDEGNESTQTIVNNLAGTFTTDVNGNLLIELLIPASARVGQRWSVLALERNEINAEVIAKSNDFVVTTPQPPLQPILSIWPLSGPARTSISVVGSNFPSMREIQYSFGESGASPSVFGTTWTEFNGTFAIDLIIPNSADPGDIWVVEAEVTDDPAIQTISPEFSVEGP